jgi:transcriptional regulator with XRE-family HTH domain
MVAEQGRDWLSRTLRELREATGLSGSAAARQAGLSQSRISRIESGRFLPTEAEINTLADLYDVRPAVRRRLLRTVKALREEVAPARAVLQHHGAWRLQQRIATIEKNAAEISGFANTIVPGLLQTADYARAVFAGGGDIPPEDQDKAVAERVARSAVLEEGSRKITLIMTEGALKWNAGPRIMVEQLEHLAGLAGGKRVRIGVIPWTQPASAFPLHGFNMYDRREVVIGTWAATAFIRDAQDVAAYSKLFDELEVLAAFGPDAAKIISGIADDYRQLS